MSEKNLLWDYLVFIVFVIATTFVAVYSRIFGGKEKTKAEYVFAAGKVSMSAMMLSIARGTIGVRSFLGYPSELYYRGSAMWETLWGMILAYPIVAYVFVPVYFSLDITSVYQYLDLRFKSRLVRCLASGTYVVRQLLNLGVTVFTPCVALNTVIGIPYWASIFGITIISIIFTILGGLKAAILADVMQGLTMIALCMVMIIKGTLEANGFGEVMKKNIDGGRLDFFNWDLDPTIRVTTTSAIVGQLFMSLSIFGCQQNFVQRYISMDSQKKVNKTLWCNIPVITVLFSMSWVVGMVIYAIYSDCDPLTSGYIKKYDEILPFFVEDRFNAIPGIMGLFMASLFNGALSLNVSNLNSLATVTFEDFIRPIPAMKNMQDKHQLMAIKIVGVVYGFIIMGISFGVGLLSGVIESSMLVTSATSGPLLGVFVLAMLIPCCNWKGASTGVILGHLVTLWLTFGGLTVDKPPTQILPLSVEGCSNSSFNPHVVKHVHAWPVTGAYDFMNRSAQAYAAHPAYKYQLTSNQLYNASGVVAAAIESTTSTTTTVPGVAPTASDPLTALYQMTYMYYSLIGCFVTVGMGWLISILTQSEDDIYDEKLLHPMARKYAAYFPGAKRRYADKTQSRSRNESVRSKNSHVIPPIIAPPASITIENNKSASYSQQVSLEDETNVYNTRL